MLPKSAKLNLEMASVYEAPRQGLQPAVPDAAIVLSALDTSPVPSVHSQNDSRLQHHLALDESRGEIEPNVLPAEGVIVTPPELPPPYLLPKTNFKRHPRVSEAFRKGKLDEANRQGFEAEWKVGKLVSSVPFVRKVVQSRPNGPQDHDGIDLIARTVSGFIVPDYLLQVKLKRVDGVGNRDKGNRLGRKFGKQMAHDDPDYATKSPEERARLKKERKLRERRVYIYLSKEVEGVVTQATNEEIIASFTSQALEIAHYYQSLRPTAA